MASHVARALGQRSGSRPRAAAADRQPPPLLQQQQEPPCGRRAGDDSDESLHALELRLSQQSQEEGPATQGESEELEEGEEEEGQAARGSARCDGELDGVAPAGATRTRRKSVPQAPHQQQQPVGPGHHQGAGPSRPQQERGHGAAVAVPRRADWAPAHGAGPQPAAGGKRPRGGHGAQQPHSLTDQVLTHGRAAQRGQPLEKQVEAGVADLLKGTPVVGSFSNELASMCQQYRQQAAVSPPVRCAPSGGLRIFDSAVRGAVQQQRHGAGAHTPGSSDGHASGGGRHAAQSPQDKAGGVSSHGNAALCVSPAHLKAEQRRLGRAQRHPQQQQQQHTGRPQRQGQQPPEQPHVIDLASSDSEGAPG